MATGGARGFGGRGVWGAAASVWLWRRRLGRCWRRGATGQSFHGLVASQLTGVHAAPQGIRVCQTSVECDRTHTILCPHHLAFIDYTLHNLRVFG